MGNCLKVYDITMFSLRAKGTWTVQVDIKLLWTSFKNECNVEKMFLPQAFSFCFPPVSVYPICFLGWNI